MEKFISTKVHGVLDYIMGVGLMSLPFLMNFRKKSAESVIPITLGASAIMYSLITDYEMGVARGISMKTHLMIDKMSGFLLAASPLLFGFKNRVSLPHVLLGLTEIITAFSTREDATPNNGPELKDYLPNMILEKLDGRRVVVA